MKVFAVAVICLFVGCFFGVAWMCLLQIGRGETEWEEGSQTKSDR